MKGVFLDTHPIDRSDINFTALQQLRLQWSFYERTPPSEVISRAKSADVIITNKVLLKADSLAQLPNLKCLIVAATGTNNIDLLAAQKQGIVICNVRDYGTDSVAQHALMLMLCLATKVLEYNEAAKDGRWAASDNFSWAGPPPFTLANKTLGIVGLGTTGRKVQQLAEAFGMRVQVAQRDPSDSRPNRIPWELFLNTSDFISLHCPLVPQTEGLMNAWAFEQMKPTAYLINVARGPIIDEAALAHALKSNQIAGAGLDVLCSEPPVADNPLLDAGISNLLVTPHVAWASQEARQQLVDQLAEILQAFIEGKPKNQVL